MIVSSLYRLGTIQSGEVKIVLWAKAKNPQHTPFSVTPLVNSVVDLTHLRSAIITNYIEKIKRTIHFVYIFYKDL